MSVNGFSQFNCYLGKDLQQHFDTVGQTIVPARVHDEAQRFFKLVNELVGNGVVVRVPANEYAK